MSTRSLDVDSNVRVCNKNVPLISTERGSFAVQFFSSYELLLQFKIPFCPGAVYFLTISKVNYMHADTRKTSRRSWMRALVPTKKPALRN